MQNFPLTVLTFRVIFNAFDFLLLAWSIIPSQSQFHAAELNVRHFNTKSQMKSAPKLVPFFTLIRISAIC